MLGSQVNTRNSIVATGGGAIETQQEFLSLFESSVIENDISSSVQRYQLATQEAKLRLDRAIAPGVWLTLSLPRVTLQILLCLTPDDFTRQMETPWE